MRVLKVGGLAALLTLALASEARAIPSGPVVLVGYVLAPQKTSQSTTSSDTLALGPLSGPAFQVGYEIGDYVNNQFTFQFSSSGGPVAGSSGGVMVNGTANLQTYGLGYQLTYDIFGKAGLYGLTPYIGGGLVVGMFNLTEPLQATAGGSSFSGTGIANGQLYLELHATAGVRYTFADGLGLRADLMYSTYGGFLGTFIPELGVAYRL